MKIQYLFYVVAAVIIAVGGCDPLDKPEKPDTEQTDPDNTTDKEDGSGNENGSGAEDNSDNQGNPGGEGNGDTGGNDEKPEPEPEVAIGWLELPAEGGVDTAEEYTFMAGERNYTAYYDTETYSSLWVAYPLAKGHIGNLKRPSGWYYAPDIEEAMQVNLTKRSYNDNYSRGHQIPNGDRNGNSDLQKQTFYVINSVPQIQDRFNGKIWNSLEDGVRASIPDGDTLYIATGPVYKTVNGAESIKYTSAKDDTKEIPVANYFFKVVLKVKRSGQQITAAKAIGFWLEHKDYSGSNYDSYAVTVDSIEEKTGFDFFVNLPDELEAAAEQNSSWSAFKSF